MVKKVVHLDTLKGLPGKYLKRLSAFREVFMVNSSLEELIDSSEDLKAIVEDINDYCNEHYIVGYHYTRADPKSIKKDGILCRNATEIQEKFIETYGSFFSYSELLTMRACWSEFPKWSRMSSRDNLIFFNTTEVALRMGGASDLLGYAGGEQIYFGLYDQPEILQKLRVIGKSQIVVFRVAGSKADGTGMVLPWGRIACSSYHRIFNSEVTFLDVDATVGENIMPSDILQIKYM